MDLLGARSVMTTRDSSINRRAERALRWYPAVWRDRFGEEFVALMEDDMAERQRWSRRGLNVAWKGSVARLVDFGVIGQTSDPPRQVRVGFATTMFFGLFFLATAPNLWAAPMIAWHTFGTQRASAIVTLTTGLLTLSLGVISITVALSLFGLLGSAFWSIVRGSGRRLLVPTAAILASAAYLAVAAHLALRYVIAVGGIQWSDPGIAMKQVAGASSSVVSSVESAVFGRGSDTDGLVLGLSPLILLAFCIAVAVLIRRTEFSRRTNRTVRFTMKSMVVMALVFLASYLLWTLAVGDANSLPYEGGSFPFLEFGIIAFAAAGCSSCVAPRRWRMASRT
jgi:hypothetical protein